MEEIKVTISPDGQIAYEVRGVKGAKCRDLTKAIDAISGKILETKKTGEFCELPAQNKLHTGS